MKAINKILTVIDDSELTRDILKKSIELATMFDATIIILYTIHIPFFNLPTYKKDVPIDKEVVKNNINKIFDELNQKSAIAYYTLVYFGDNSQRAIIEAKRDAVDMIVTCSNIKYEKLIRETQKPILIVKSEYKEYQNILIPTDLSSKSKDGIEFVKSSFDANLSLVYAYESIATAMSMYDISYIDMAEYQDSNREIALKLFDRFKEELEMDGELIDSYLSITSEILNYIEDKRPDLVSVSSHSSQESFFVGSISSYLAKELSCDIFIYC